MSDLFYPSDYKRVQILGERLGIVVNEHDRPGTTLIDLLERLVDKVSYLDNALADHLYRRNSEDE